MRKLPLLLAGCAMIAFPGSAFGQEQVPERDSALDQYVEGVPGSGGERATGRDGGRSGNGGGPTLSPGVRSTLEAQGPLGAAVVDLVEASGVASGDRDSASGDLASGDRDSARGGSGRSGEEGAVTANAEQGSGVGNALKALFGGVGGGMGIALPFILGGGLVAAALVFVARRRGGGGDSAPPV